MKDQPGTGQHRLTSAKPSNKCEGLLFFICVSAPSMLIIEEQFFPLLERNDVHIHTSSYINLFRFPQKSQRLEITGQLCGPGVQQMELEAFFSHQVLCPGSV